MKIAYILFLLAFLHTIFGIRLSIHSKQDENIPPPLNQTDIDEVYDQGYADGMLFSQNGLRPEDKAQRINNLPSNNARRLQMTQNQPENVTNSENDICIID